MGGACSAYGGEMYAGFCWRKLRERNQLGGPGVDGTIILKCIFRKWDEGVWTGLIWLRRGTGGGYL